MSDPATRSPLRSLLDVGRRLGGSVGRASLGIVVQNLLNLAATLYVSRALGVEWFGLFGLGIFFSVQAAQLLQWGASPLVVRELVRAPDAAPRILAACLIQRGVAAAVILVGGLLLAVAWRGEGGWLLVWLGLADGVLLGFSLPAAFDARRRIATHVAIAHVRPLGYLLGAVALKAAAPAWFGPRSVLVVHAAAIALSVALEWAWIVRQHGIPSVHGAGATAGGLWREAAPLAMGDVATSLLTYASVPAIAWLGHPEDTGHLNLSNQLAVSLASLAAPPSQALHAHLAARPDPWAPSFTREALALTGALCVGAALMCACVTVASPWLVPLVFGDAYHASGRLLQVDCWRLVGVLGGAALVSTLACRGRAGLLAACQAGGLLVSVGVALACVPRVGAVGASAGASLGRMAALAALLAAVVLARRPRA